MLNKVFDNDSKDSFMKDICESCFNKNFGKLAKSDFELLLFKNYVDACKKENQETSDYELSKQLGITQNRVRTLKQLKYKKYDLFEDGWWKNEINKSLVNVHFDKNNNTIKFIVDDVNAKEELIHFIESRGWYDDATLNKKLVSIPLQCYFDIFVDNDSFKDTFSKDAKKKLKDICEDDSLDSNNKNKILEFTKEFSKDALSDILKSGTKEIVLIILKTLPFGGVLAEVVSHIIDVINKS